MRLVAGFTQVVLLSILVVGGCGGESFEAGDDSAAGDDGETGGSTGVSGAGGKGSAGQAGSAPQAGSAGTGGSTTGSGGSSAVGGAGGSVSAGTGQGATAGTGQGATSGAGQGGTGGVGDAGDGGTGGEPEDLCRLPADAGPCDGTISRWAFNAEAGLCQSFIYGGCPGNENNFETLEACHAKCAGHGVVDYTSCTSPIECVVTQARCCGTDSPTLAEVTSVNATSLQAFTSPCEGLGCPSFPLPAHFGATCKDGHCLAFDVRETELTDCASPDECRLRNGLSCCEACSASVERLVALRSDADLVPLVCGSEPIGCPACVPILPEDVVADCIEGKCEVASSLR
jgi:hypothetical protein